MNDFLLFNQSIESLRRVGRLGGKATARNRRARQKAMCSVPAHSLPPITAPMETAAEAIATLDAKFPWLQDAQRRCDARR
jgi:hypothetical protein